VLLLFIILLDTSAVCDYSSVKKNTGLIIIIIKILFIIIMINNDVMINKMMLE